MGGVQPIMAQSHIASIRKLIYTEKRNSYKTESIGIFDDHNHSFTVEDLTTKD